MKEEFIIIYFLVLLYLVQILLIYMLFDDDKKELKSKTKLLNFVFYRSKLSFYLSFIPFYWVLFIPYRIFLICKNTIIKTSKFLTKQRNEFNEHWKTINDLKK